MKFIKYSYKIQLSLILLIILGCVSCKKLIDVGPPKTEVVSELVYGDEVTAINALVSIYGDMMSNNNFVSDYCSSYLGYTADELVANSTSVFAYNNNALTLANDDFWSKGYSFIYEANAVKEGTEKSTKLSDSTKRQIIGESLFIRAFCHFYMVNLFGDVPYIDTTDYRVTNIAVREPVSQVYDKILKDLLTARGLVKSSYVMGNNGAYPSNSSIERVRPNKAVVSALIARTYLYMGNWAQAETEASALISNPAYSLLANLDQVFLKNSTETIWQLMPSNPTYLNGYSGYNYILNGSYGARPYLTDVLWNAVSPGDKRKTIWMGTYSGLHFAYKYKVSQANMPATEYYMVFRLAEQYLIRAEARAHQNNIAGAVSDLNALLVRARVTPANLPNYSSSLTQAQCLDAIAHERQVELFTEWGHRWLDLKRTGTADAVLKAFKGTTKWQVTDQLFPLPQSQITLNPNMSNQQNPGY
ncbi:MAG: RagB/SusD family nutrient uptake outer membrane protein [Mucilaginibacter sp.]|nr:RagB/SusD family nutrient uptake outer membrane protein [Mucilaginibacter sp.]